MKNEAGYPSEKNLYDDEITDDVEDLDDADTEENPAANAARLRRNKKGQFKAGSGKKKGRAKKGGAKAKKGRAKGAKKGKTPKGILARVKRLESVTGALVQHDKVTRGYLTGFVNAARKANGRKAIKTLPGYKPIPGYKTPVARRAL